MSPHPLSRCLTAQDVPACARALPDCSDARVWGWCAECAGWGRACVDEISGARHLDVLPPSPVPKATDGALAGPLLVALTILAIVAARRLL